MRASAVDLTVQGALPWFLSPLRPAGFLGRLVARRLALHGVDADPERWPLAQVLFAALQTHDAPGALVLGELPLAVASVPALPAADRASGFDALAADVAATLPAGSSAGGEQAKFLAQVEDRHVVVKFSPPRGTPFGERWHDLLHAEHLAHGVLAEHGVPVARTAVVETARRTYLESARFADSAAYLRDRRVAAAKRAGIPPGADSSSSASAATRR